MYTEWGQGRRRGRRTAKRSRRRRRRRREPFESLFLSSRATTERYWFVVVHSPWERKSPSCVWRRQQRRKKKRRTKRRKNGDEKKEAHSTASLVFLSFSCYFFNIYLQIQMSRARGPKSDKTVTHRMKFTKCKIQRANMIIYAANWRCCHPSSTRMQSLFYEGCSI